MRVELENPLWLLAPSTAGHVLVASAAVVAVWLAGVLPEQGAGSFVLASGVAVALTAFLAAALAQLSLKTYSRLAAGAATSEAERLAAFVEVRRFPRTLLFQALGFWVGAVLALAIYGRLSLGMELYAVRRLLLLGAAFGALGSTWVFFPVTRRGRQMQEAMAAGLPLQKVIATAKGGRQRLRGILVAFTLAAVIFPALLLFDTVRVDSMRAAEQIGAAKLGPERESLALSLKGEITRRALGLSALMMVFALLMAREAGRTLAQPLRRLADEATRLSRGELGAPRFIAAEAESWAVTSAFTLTQARLYDAVGQLQGAGQRITVTTDRLLGTSARYESGAAEQAASLNETSATTEELAQSARQISQNATAVTQIAEKTLEAVRAGQQAAEDFARAVERMKHDNRAITEAVVRLQKRVQQIGRIVEFINTVADRSDLLALSAELEGTKAGEVGRGFTLVASEMRRLAENVIESTNEIEELIAEIRDATRNTVSATEEGLARTEGGMALAGDVTRSLDAVVDMARRTSEAVRAITLATQQQQTGTDQLAEAMADILGITQQGLAATRQLTSANQDLIGLARDLHGLVGHFKVLGEDRA